MKIFKCFKCGNTFCEVDLLITKCSENFVGTYLQTSCPRCMGKRPPIYSELKEISDGKEIDENERPVEDHT